MNQIDSSIISISSPFFNIWEEKFCEIEFLEKIFEKFT